MPRREAHEWACRGPSTLAAGASGTDAVIECTVRR